MLTFAEELESVRLARRYPIEILEAATTVLQYHRPPSLRTYDQIPMRHYDLIKQVLIMSKKLAGQTVAFMGDHDGTSLLLGLLQSLCDLPMPARMLLLDFDERLLEVALQLAKEYDFAHLLDVRLYNVFDPIPLEIAGASDWFYTNPPYGQYNDGESARLFITRCIELVHEGSSKGCIILPDDQDRQWTTLSMYKTQKFLNDNGWSVDEKSNKVHKYHLDDDKDLASSVMLVKREISGTGLSYAGRRVEPHEILNFYGRSEAPPYPRYILKDGSYDYRW